ncbi:hypothetical protein [Lactococcus lactis]|nr:hypothetical protein [Lactococcus lactis]MDT2867750.1 hypothetical protein [Lactococcus lactis]MDT2877933.1 hypothetical protein [Lactococcus lactis]MDT2883805.1 hypothetical protein [Lactococcus lactis]MDT2947851.1 hypothetical protein [Lactococcus lactis]MDV4191774.1 hypothetical protein [Lactococcus lactis subsp. lactis]
MKSNDYITSVSKINELVLLTEINTIKIIFLSGLMKVNENNRIS